MYERTRALLQKCMDEIFAARPRLKVVERRDIGFSLLCKCYGLNDKTRSRLHNWVAAYAEKR